MLLSSVKARLAATSLFFASQLVISKQWVTGQLHRKKEGDTHQHRGVRRRVSMRRNYSSIRLDAAVLPGSFGVKNKVRLTELRKPVSQPQRWGQAYLGICAASVCTPLAVAGEEGFLWLPSDRHAGSQEFQKIVFSSSQLKLFGWQILEILFNFTKDRHLLERILECLLWSKGSNDNVGWAACVSGAVNEKAAKAPGSHSCCLPRSVARRHVVSRLPAGFVPAFSFSL